MKKTGLRLLIATVVTLSVCAMCLFGCGSGRKNYADKNSAYFIGASGPLTGSAATYGIAVQNGANLAVKEINAQGGDQFKFQIYDDKASTSSVGTNFASLYEDGMQVSLGAVTSGSCLEFKNYASDKSVFCLCPSATADDVTKNSTNMFQMCFSDSNQGSVTVEWMQSDNKSGEKNVATSTRIGVLYCSNDAYSTGIYNTFKSAAQKAGYTISAVASFTNDAEGNPPTDFSSQVGILKDCQFIFMPIYYTPAATFMEAAQKSTMSGDAVFFGCDGFDGIDTMVGFDINSIKQEVSMLSHFNAKSDSAKSKAFVEAYQKEYGSTPNQFAASAYDCVYAIAKAIATAKQNGKDVPVNISAQDMAAVLRETLTSADFTFDGVTGNPIQWNTDGTVNKTAQKFEIKAKA